MESQVPAVKKVGVRTTLIILAVIAIPSFFWFRFLYDQFVVDKVTPQMAKMRDGIMHPKPPTAPSKGLITKKAVEKPGEKGETREK